MRSVDAAGRQRTTRLWVERLVATSVGGRIPQRLVREASAALGLSAAQVYRLVAAHPAVRSERREAEPVEDAGNAVGVEEGDVSAGRTVEPNEHVRRAVAAPRVPLGLGDEVDQLDEPSRRHQEFAAGAPEASEAVEVPTNGIGIELEVRLGPVVHTRLPVLFSAVVRGLLRPSAATATEG